MSTGAFLRTKTVALRDKYSELLKAAATRLSPVIELHETEEGTFLMVCIRREASKGYAAYFLERQLFRNSLNIFSFLDCILLSVNWLTI